MTGFPMVDLHALTEMEPCARRSDWCDGTVCHQWGGCPLADPDRDSETILRAHNRAMHSPGTMAKDLLELGLIQADEQPEWACAPEDSVLGDGIDSDYLEAAIHLLAPWMPTEAGW